VTFGDPEDALGQILIAGLKDRLPGRFGGHVVLGAGVLDGGLEDGLAAGEDVGDVLEKDEAQDDVLVLGRVHVGAKPVGRLPQGGLKPLALLLLPGRH